MNNSTFKINDISIGDEFKPQVIVEIGINHDGNFDRAIQLIDVAREQGARIIKFQCHIVEKEMLKTDLKPGKISDESLWDIIERSQLSYDEEKKIKKYCETKGLLYLSTPFSLEAVDRLDEMGIPAFKVGSGECNNPVMIEHIAKKAKPIILSTGMNDMESIRESVSIIQKHKTPFALLHCTSMYPTPYKQVRLGAMLQLKEEFPGVPVGLSDHSLGIYTALGAVALGASLIEKHFTVNKDWPGPDNKISIEPEELKHLILGTNAIWEAKGGTKNVLPEEQDVIEFAYGSVVSLVDIEEGTFFDRDNIGIRRPGTGDFLAREFSNIIGKKAATNIKKDSLLRLSDVLG